MGQASERVGQPFLGLFGGLRGGGVGAGRGLAGGRGPPGQEAADRFGGFAEGSDEMSDVSNQAPYGGDELLEQAAKAAKALNIPERRREDAESEYVLGALEALRKDDRPGDIRAFQRQCGHNAMLKFLRREIRHESLSPGNCPRGAEKKSLEQLVPDENGMMVSLAETVPDPSYSTPDTVLIRAEREAAVRRAVERLEPELMAGAIQVLVEGKTQEKAAEYLGITRRVLETQLNSAKQRLQESLSSYRVEYAGMRIGKNK
jgi:RNA polymerase sigma factor (sigma-70 family)